MNAEFIRDAAATAALFGFFAASWFGWAQENPPAAWRNPVALGGDRRGCVDLATLVGWHGLQPADRAHFEANCGH